jgi:pimeloyl-ACP methyl ester carboxylesterase
VADVVALLDAAGVERVHLVGHDWGGGVAWMVAATRPDRVHMARAYAARLVDDPGRLAAALRWYRAMPLDLAVGLRTGAVTVPTTYVWSTGDIAIGRRAAELTSRWVTGPYDFTVLDGVSHWIPEQAPDELATHILHRIRSGPPTT